MSATPKTQMEFAPEYDKPVRYMQRTREWYLTLDTTLGDVQVDVEKSAADVAG